MKVLLVTDEVWNDRIHGNNVLSNWFEGFPAQIAQIYCTPGLPRNLYCEKYFQITDRMMIDSILHRKKAGLVVEEYEETETAYNSTDLGNIGFLRNHMGNVLRFMKSIVWSIGSYDEDTLRDFIEEFNPDLVFCPRMANPKLLHLERVVHKYSKCPMVAFTGDNEYSLRYFSLSPIGWINLLWNRYELRKNSQIYSLYYTLSDEQKYEYERDFNCPIKILRKCAEIEQKKMTTGIHEPIKMVYAGKLYCNRWKTLSSIGNVLHHLNRDSVKITLDIFTKDKLSRKQIAALHFPGTVIVHGGITQEAVFEQYKNSDITLHIESFDLKYRLATRVSFSTKIIDCLKSGSAVMVVAWKQHSGLTYLKRENAAICVDNIKSLEDTIRTIVDSPEIVEEYKTKAYECLVKNHNKTKVQEELYRDWESIINGQSIKRTSKNEDSGN